MVRSGELAAVIMGTKQGAPKGLERLVPDVDGAITEWFEKHQAVPINHMVVFREGADIDAVHKVYDLLGCRAFKSLIRRRTEQDGLRCDAA